ncbi:hypothetical protein [Streptosporangium sp. NPDC002607]
MSPMLYDLTTIDKAPPRVSGKMCPTVGVEFIALKEFHAEPTERG